MPTSQNVAYSNAVKSQVKDYVVHIGQLVTEIYLTKRVYSDVL